MSHRPEDPALSVVILNYNGAKWLERCLASLRAQTFFDRIEVIVADNASSDGSDQLARRLLDGWANGRFLDNGGNLGYCAGNNRGAETARGKYLFFLNNDTWLEPDCLEQLWTEAERTQAGAAGSLVLDYADNNFQSIGGTGFDWMGFPNVAQPPAQTAELFAVCGAAYLIRADLFKTLGGFDGEFFLYADETDLSWRVWIAGHSVVGIPSSKVHHRGAVDVNPKGEGKIVESRTSISKRFYANRNSLLFLLKNCQHILLLMVVPHLLFLAMEALAALVLVRSWALLKQGYWHAVVDCWRMRRHVFAERRRIRAFRRRGDFWMLRFLHLMPSRWHEVKRALRFGAPIVDKR